MSEPTKLFLNMSICPPPRIGSILTSCCLLFPFHLSGADFMDDFEEQPVGPILQADWTVMRTKGGQSATVVADELANPHGNSGDQWLRLQDNDDTPGMFGPAIRYHLPARPTRIAFDVLLLDGREFPAMVLANSSETLFQLILSDGGRSRQLSYRIGSQITGLDYTMELDTWYGVELAFGDEVKLSIQPMDGDLTEFTLPLGKAEQAAAANLDFMLSGSSAGMHGDILLDNIVVSTGN